MEPAEPPAAIENTVECGSKKPQVLQESDKGRHSEADEKKEDVALESDMPEEEIALPQGEEDAFRTLLKSKSREHTAACIQELQSAFDRDTAKLTFVLQWPFWTRALFESWKAIHKTYDGVWTRMARTVFGSTDRITQEMLIECWAAWAVKFLEYLKAAALAGLTPRIDDATCDELCCACYPFFEREQTDTKLSPLNLADLVFFARLCWTVSDRHMPTERLQQLAQGDMVDAAHISWRLMSCIALLPPKAVITLLNSRVSLLAPAVLDFLGDPRVTRLCATLKNDEKKYELIERAYNTSDEDQRFAWLPWTSKLSVWLAPTSAGELPRKCAVFAVLLLALEQPETTGQCLLDRAVDILPLDWVTRYLTRRCDHITVESMANLHVKRLLEVAGARAPAGTLMTLLQALLSGLQKHRPHSDSGILAPAYIDALTLLAALEPLPRNALSLVFNSVTEPVTITQLATLLLSCSAFLRRFDAAVAPVAPAPVQLPPGTVLVPEVLALLPLPEAEQLEQRHFVRWRFDVKDQANLEAAKRADITEVYTCTFRTLVDRLATANCGATLELPLLPLGQTCIQLEDPISTRPSVVRVQAAKLFRETLVQWLTAMTAAESRADSRCLHLDQRLLPFVRAVLPDDHAIAAAATQLDQRDLDRIRESVLEILTESRTVLAVLIAAPSHLDVLAEVRRDHHLFESRLHTARRLLVTFQRSCELPADPIDPSTLHVQEASARLELCASKPPLTLSLEQLDDVQQLWAHAAVLYDELLALARKESLCDAIAESVATTRKHLMAIATQRASVELILALRTYLERVGNQRLGEIIRPLPSVLKFGPDMSQQHVGEVILGISLMGVYLDLISVALLFVLFVKHRWSNAVDASGPLQQLHAALMPFVPSEVDPVAVLGRRSEFTKHPTVLGYLRNVPITELPLRSVRIAVPLLSLNGSSDTLVAQLRADPKLWDTQLHRLHSYLCSMWNADKLLEFYTTHLTQFDNLLSLIRSNTESDSLNIDALNTCENARPLCLPIITAPKPSVPLSATDATELHTRFLQELARWPEKDLMHGVLESAKRNFPHVEALFLMTDNPTSDSELPLVESVRDSGVLVSSVQPPAWYVEYYSNRDPWHNELRALVALLSGSAEPTADAVNAHFKELHGHKRDEVIALKELLATFGWRQPVATPALINKRAEFLTALQARVVPRLSSEAALARLQSINMFIERKNREAAFNVFDQLLTQGRAYHAARCVLFDHGMLCDPSEPVVPLDRVPPAQHTQLAANTRKLTQTGLLWKDALHGAYSKSSALRMLSYAQLRQLMGRLKRLPANADAAALRRAVAAWQLLTTPPSGYAAALAKVSTPAAPELLAVRAVATDATFQPLAQAIATVSSDWNLGIEDRPATRLRVVRSEHLHNSTVVRLVRHYNVDQDPHPAQLLNCTPHTSLADLDQFLARGPELMLPFFVVQPERLSTEARNLLHSRLRVAPRTDLFLLVRTSVGGLDEFSYITTDNPTLLPLAVDAQAGWSRVVAAARVGKSHFIRRTVAFRFVMNETFEAEQFSQQFGTLLAVATPATPVHIHFDVSPYADMTRCEQFFRALIRWQLVLHSDGTAVYVPHQCLRAYIELSTPSPDGDWKPEQSLVSYYQNVLPSVMYLTTDLPPDVTFLPDAEALRTLTLALTVLKRSQPDQVVVFLRQKFTAQQWAAWSNFQKQQAVLMMASRYEWLQRLQKDKTLAAGFPVAQNPHLQTILDIRLDQMEDFLVSEVRVLVNTSAIRFQDPPALGTRIYKFPAGDELGMVWPTLTAYDVGGRCAAPGVHMQNPLKPDAPRPKERAVTPLMLCREWLSGVLGKDETMSIQQLLETHKYVLTADYAFKLALLCEYQKYRRSVILCGDTGVGKTELLKMFALLVNERHVPNALRVIADQFDPGFRKLYGAEVALVSVEGLHAALAEWVIMSDATRLPEVARATATRLVTAAVQLVSAPILDLTAHPDIAALGASPEACARLIDSLSALPPTPNLSATDYVLSSLTRFAGRLLSLTVRQLFQALLIHPTVTASELRAAVAQAQAHAEALAGLPGAKYVVLVDEFNTGSETLGLIREVLSDHSLDGRPLPDALLWVAASNPTSAYNVRGTHESVSRELQLEYRRLSETQEDMFIDQLFQHHADITEDPACAGDAIAHLESLKKAIGAGQKLLHKAHNKSTKGESQNNIHMSVRDILRARDMYRYFFKEAGGQAIMRAAFTVEVTPTARHWVALIASMYLSYVARLDPATCAPERQELRTHTNNAVLANETVRGMFRQLLRLDVLPQGYDVCSRVEEALQRGLWRNSQIPVGVAATPAILQNLFFVVTMADTRRGVLIVGRPGCGKTLSFTIAGANLRSPQQKIYLDLHALVPFRYQCTLSSTDREIETQYLQARRSQASFMAMQPPQHCMVLLDEASLPSEKNAALKVLHYYLDDQTNARVGSLLLANQVLDPAKTNRLFVLFHEQDEATETAQLAELASGVLYEQRCDELRVDHQRAMVQGLIKGLKHINEPERLALSVCPLTFNQRDVVSFLRYLRRFGSADRDGVELTAEHVLLAMEYVFSAVGPAAFAHMVHQLFTNLGMQVPADLRDNSEARVREVLLSKLTEADNVNMACERYVMLLDETDTEAAVEMFAQATGETMERVRISDFPDDMSEAALADHIRDMKLRLRGDGTTVLLNALSISTSFYDVINRHFRIFVDRNGGKRFYARVAMGAHSRECMVNPNFKLVVHVPMSRLAQYPEPFLDRFQKFRLTPALRLQCLIDTATPDQRDLYLAAAEVKVEAVRMMQGVSDSKVLFYGALHEHTVSSLLLRFLANPTDPDAVRPLTSAATEPVSLDPANVRADLLNCVNRKLLQIAQPPFVFSDGTLPRDYHSDYWEGQPHFALQPLLALLQARRKADKHPPRAVVYVRASADVLAELDSLGTAIGQEAHCFYLAHCSSAIEVQRHLAEARGLCISVADMSLCTQQSLNNLHSLAAAQVEPSGPTFVSLVLAPVSMMVAARPVTHSLFLQDFDYFYLDGISLQRAWEEAWRTAVLEPAQWLSVAVGLHPELPNEPPMIDNMRELFLSVLSSRVQVTGDEQVFDFRPADIDPLPGTALGVECTPLRPSAANRILPRAALPSPLKCYGRKVWRGKLSYKTQEMNRGNMQCQVVVLQPDGTKGLPYNDCPVTLLPDELFTCNSDEDRTGCLVKFLKENPELYEGVLRDLLRAWTSSRLADTARCISEGVKAAGKRSFAAELRDVISNMVHHAAYHVGSVLCGQMQLPLVRAAVKNAVKRPGDLRLLQHLLQAQELKLTALQENLCVTTALDKNAPCPRLVGYPTLSAAIGVLADQAYKTAQQSAPIASGAAALDFMQRAFAEELLTLIGDRKHVANAVAEVNGDKQLREAFLEDFVMQELSLPLFSAPPYSELLERVVQHLTPTLGEERLVEKLYIARYLALEGANSLALRSMKSHLSALQHLREAPELRFVPPYDCLPAELLVNNLWRVFAAPAGEARNAHSIGWGNAFKAMRSDFPDLLSEHQGLSALSATRTLVMFTAFEAMLHFEAEKATDQPAHTLCTLLQRCGFPELLATLAAPNAAQHPTTQIGAARWEAQFGLVNRLCIEYQDKKEAVVAFLQTVLPRLLPNNLSILLQLCDKTNQAALPSALRDLSWQWAVEQLSQCMRSSGMAADGLFRVAEPMDPAQRRLLPAFDPAHRSFVPPCIPTQVVSVATYVRQPNAAFSPTLENALFEAIVRDFRTQAASTGAAPMYRQLATLLEAPVSSYYHDIKLAARECVVLELAADQLNKQLLRSARPLATGEKSAVELLVQQWHTNEVLVLLNKLWAREPLRLYFIMHTAPPQLQELLQHHGDQPQSLVQCGPHQVVQVANNNLDHIFLRLRRTLVTDPVPVADIAAARYAALRTAVASGEIAQAIGANAVATGGDLAGDLLLVCYYEHYSQGRAAPALVVQLLNDQNSPLRHALGQMGDKQINLLRRFCGQPPTRTSGAQEDHLTNLFAHPSHDARLATVLINVMTALIAVRDQRTFLHRIAFEPSTLTNGTPVPGGRALMDCYYKDETLAADLQPAVMGNSPLRHRHALAVIVWSSVTWGLLLEPAVWTHYTNGAATHLLNFWNETPGGTPEIRARIYTMQRVEVILQVYESDCAAHARNASALLSTVLDNWRIAAAAGTMALCATTQNVLACEDALRAQVFWPAEQSCNNAAHMQPYNEVVAAGSMEMRNLLHLRAEALGTRSLPLVSWQEILPLLSKAVAGEVVESVVANVPSIERSDSVRTLVTFYVMVSRALNGLLPPKALLWPFASSKTASTETVLAYLLERRLVHSSKVTELRRLLSQLIQSWHHLRQRLNVFAMCMGGANNNAAQPNNARLAQQQREVEELSEENASLALLMGMSNEEGASDGYLLDFVTSFLSNVQTPLVAAALAAKVHPLRGGGQAGSSNASQSSAAVPSLFDLLSQHNSHVLVGSRFTEADLHTLLLSRVYCDSNGAPKCNWPAIEALLVERVISGRVMLAAQEIRVPFKAEAIDEQQQQQQARRAVGDGLAQSLDVAVAQLPIAAFPLPTRTDAERVITNALFAQAPRPAPLFQALASLRRICVTARPQHPLWSATLDAARQAAAGTDAVLCQQSLDELLVLKDLRAHALLRRLRSRRIVGAKDTRLGDGKAPALAAVLNETKSELMQADLSAVTIIDLAAFADESLAGGMLDIPVVREARALYLRVIGLDLCGLYLELDLGGGEANLAARSAVEPVLRDFTEKINSAGPPQSWLALLLDLLVELTAPAVRECLLREPERLLSKLLSKKVLDGHTMVTELFGPSVRAKHLPAVVSHIRGTARELYLLLGARSPNVLGLRSNQQPYVERWSTHQKPLERPATPAPSAPAILSQQPQSRAPVTYTKRTAAIGIPNVSNTCYMGCALQCFAVTGCMPDAPPADSPAVYSLASFWSVLRNLRAAQPSVERSQLESISVETTTRDLVRGRCNDVSEFVHHVLDKSGVALQNEFRVKCPRRTDCPRCGLLPVTAADDGELELTLPLPTKAVSIEELIQANMESSVIPDLKCERCQKSGDCKRRCSFEALPTVLLAVVRRNANGETRNVEEVRLAPELALPYGTDQRTEYVLYATINYDGMGNDGGHYTCYCRDQHDRMRWHWFSDSEVRQVEMTEVLSSRAARNVTIAWYVRRTTDLQQGAQSQPAIPSFALVSAELLVSGKAEIEAEADATVDQLQARLLTRHAPIPQREQRWWVQMRHSSEWHRLATWLEDCPDDLPLLQRLRLERVSAAAKK